MKKIYGIELIPKIEELASKIFDDNQEKINHENASYLFENEEEIFEVLGEDDTIFGVLKVQYLKNTEFEGKEIVYITLVKNEEEVVLKEGYRLTKKL